VQFSLRRLLVIVTCAAVTAALARVPAVGPVIAIAFAIWACGVFSASTYIAEHHSNSVVGSMIVMLIFALGLAWACACIALVQ
jgi:hypothetical protein